MFTIQLLPEKTEWKIREGCNLLEALRKIGKIPEASCGGNGTCGKCKVFVDGKEVLACRTIVEKDIHISIPDKEEIKILTDSYFSEKIEGSDAAGYTLAFDIGTTTVVCYLLDEMAQIKAVESMLNPQSLYGADVITRMRWAADGKMKVLTGLIRGGMHELIETACEKAEIRPEMIVRIAVVANPCMQQLFLGISTENLTTIPFEPVLRKTECIQAKSIWSDCDQAELWIIPDISGYVGADTVGCIVASKMQEIDKTVLMVDIGTNGEMVLGNKERMAACSTAAGPALEGAKIRFGMRAGQGAIDHVFLKDGKICCSVIGDTKATGICGSGLIDAVAVFLEMEIINTRGRIRNPEELPDYIKEIDGQRVVYLTDKVYITQADIREVQLAKGAIAAGIAMMTEYLGIEYKDISQVFLAGAFGSYIQRASACRIGLLPQELEKKICAVGNAAGKGAGRIVCSRECFNSLDKLLEKVEFLELASISGFQRCFAKCTGF